MYILLIFSTIILFSRIWCASIDSQAVDSGSVCYYEEKTELESLHLRAYEISCLKFSILNFH